jgi:hypothetical protein
VEVYSYEETSEVWLLRGNINKSQHFYPKKKMAGPHSLLLFPMMALWLLLVL